MPTSTITIGESGTTTNRASAKQLPVLARIPWLSGDAQTSPEAANESLNTALTHFEYLLGEFGMDGQIATDTLAPAPGSESSDASPAVVPIERSTPNTTLLRPVVKTTPQQAFDWSDWLLRLDAAVEPYTRAVVVIVLMTVGAFSMLLLRDNEASLPTQTLPATTTARPLPGTVSASLDSKPKQPKLTPAKEVPAEAEDSKPTASGPIGLQPNREPPLATLSADLRSAPSAMESGAPEYPSTALLPPSGTRSAQLPEEATPISTRK